MANIFLVADTDEYGEEELFMPIYCSSSTAHQLLAINDKSSTDYHHAYFY